jgi:hypothetical protein
MLVDTSPPLLSILYCKLYVILSVVAGVCIVSTVYILVNGLSNQGVHGANGIQINIDGNNYYWGAGGGGVSYSAEAPIGSGISGNGGLGGGGGGCSVTGTAGTGGGSALNPGGNGTNGSGGGGGANETGNGGPGGSGIVIIRFPSFIT